MDFKPSARAQDVLDRVRTFIADHVAPAEGPLVHDLHEKNHGGDWRQWTVSPVVEELKAKARSAGLWNLFLPDAELGAGLTTLEYAPLAEAMGHSVIAPEIFNCNAPDTGNMEVLYHYGDDEQKERWLKPLLAGEIRSVFCMTEPEVASSDATNINAPIAVEGDELVINGRKWWSTGLGHPRAKIAIFMGRSYPENDRHH